jgi:hypothetical protein
MPASHIDELNQEVGAIQNRLGSSGGGGGGAVTSVFGRTAAVIAENADYISFYDEIGSAATAQVNAENFAILHDAWKNLTGDLTETQVIPWDGSTPGTPDTGISRASAGEIAVGNGTAGNVSGNVSCNSLRLGETVDTAQQWIYSQTTGVNGNIWFHASGSNYFKMDATGFQIQSGLVLGWNGYDTGISRLNPAILAVGNGAAGDASGQLKCAVRHNTGFTVAVLPSTAAAGMVEGAIAYATNGLKVGEVTGSGTGVPVYFSNGAWRVYSTDQAVAS